MVTCLQVYWWVISPDTSMTKTSKIILISLPIVLLIVFIIFNLSKSQKISVNECGNSNETNVNIDCYFALALQSNDFVQCFNIGQWANNTEEKCLVKVFQKISLTNNLDYSICEKPLNNRPDYPTANAENYWRNMCYFGVGSASRDNTVCQKITDGYAKMRCEGFATGKYSYK